MSSAPCPATTAEIASRSLTVPHGVSQCTTLTTLISGRARPAQVIPLYGVMARKP
jgi:hypothetical protein